MGPPCLQSRGGWQAGGQAWALRSPILHSRVAMTPSSAKTVRAKTDEDRFLSSVVMSNRRRTVVLDAVFDGHGGSFASDFLQQQCEGVFLTNFVRRPEATLHRFLQLGIAQLETMLLRELNWFEKVAGAVGSIVLTEVDENGKLSIACGNLGDCEVCLATPIGVDNGGAGPGFKFEMLSELHRVQNPSEKERILSLGGVIVQGSRVVHLVKVAQSKKEEKGFLLSHHRSKVSRAESWRRFEGLLCSRFGVVRRFKLSVAAMHSRLWGLHVQVHAKGREESASGCWTGAARFGTCSSVLVRAHLECPCDSNLRRRLVGWIFDDRI